MRVLAIGAHPDDIEIACSGTLAKCVKRGDTVIVCHVSSGNLGHVVIPPDELRVIRANEAKKAGALAGIEVICAGFDDLEIFASFGINTPSAAAKQAAVFYQNILAVHKKQNTADAVARLFRVACGQSCDHNIAAIKEVQHIGVPGDGGDHICVMVFAAAANGQIRYFCDKQFRTIEFFCPVIMVTIGRSVTGGLTKIDQFCVHDNFCVRPNGCQKFIRCGHSNLILDFGYDRLDFHNKRFGGFG